MSPEQIGNTIALAILAFMLFIILKAFAPRQSYKIEEFEKGVLIKRGKVKKVLKPGYHRYFEHNTVVVLDARKQSFDVQQNLLTSDNINISLSLLVELQLTDAITALKTSQNFYKEMYDTLRLISQDVIAKHSVEELVKTRTDIEKEIFELASQDASKIGLEILKVKVVDLQLPHSIQDALSSSLIDRLKTGEENKIKVGFHTKE